jgi:tRNA G18 (ribose-2'-O)-methylase SpoU
MVTDTTDPRLALYRGVRDPELLRAHGAFVAEGRMVVRRLLTASRFRARSVLVTPAARAELGDILEALGPDVPVYVAGADLFSELTGFHVHRGCLAIGDRQGHDLAWRDGVRHARTVIVLERVGNPDNVGGVFRNAAALGADAVLLSPGCSDPLYRKAIRTSMAATLTVPFAAAEPWPEALDGLRAAGFSIVALTPSSDAPDLADPAALPRRTRVALLLGHEGDGLSRDALARADHRARIPMMSGADSLNVATAAAIALYKLAEREGDRRDGLNAETAKHAEIRNPSKVISAISAVSAFDPSPRSPLPLRANEQEDAG